MSIEIYLALFCLLPDVGGHFIVDVGENLLPVGLQLLFGTGKASHNLPFTVFFPFFLLNDEMIINSRKDKGDLFNSGYLGISPPSLGQHVVP